MEQHSVLPGLLAASLQTSSLTLAQQVQFLVAARVVVDSQSLAEQCLNQPLGHQAARE
jgi:hypothetical protein